MARNQNENVMANSSRYSADHFAACLLGGAIGDALGAAPEFMSLAQIRAKFGPEGVSDFVPAYGRLGAITDDTQMTLFVAEGLLRAHNRITTRGICSPRSVQRFSHLRWYATQDPDYLSTLYFLNETQQDSLKSGLLIQQRELWSRRAPGLTCLRATPHCLENEIARNDSKGCGGVMRVAPVGLYLRGQKAFDYAVEVAQLTHGHPTGYLAAGAFALIVSRLVEGEELVAAIDDALRMLADQPQHEETTQAILAALHLARSDTAPTPEAIETLGGGWVAEEALAIGLYSALVAQDFLHGVLLAVNHSGDSDSTGSIAGNLLGLMLGKEALPVHLLAELELSGLIGMVGHDLYQVPQLLDKNGMLPDELDDRYPGF